MKKKRQTVVYEMDDENRGTYRNQEITDIQVGDEGYVEGIWKGRHVATWSLLTSEWHLI